MKHSVLACFLLVLTFMWAPPDSGNPTVGYVVEVSDRFGQIVETATVTTNTYSTDYEGTLLLSVSAIDAIDGVSAPSEWSQYEVSPKEANYLVTHAEKTDIQTLIFIQQYIATMYEIWEDPRNEDNK